MSWFGAAQARGVSFADAADGVLKALTKTALETALEEELGDHLGYDKHDSAGRGSPNSRNGSGVDRVVGRSVARVSPAWMTPPVLAVGDGALGFWKAVREVFPDAREQRCWFHKQANVLAALPKSAHPAALSAIKEIYNAEDID